MHRRTLLALVAIALSARTLSTLAQSGPPRVAFLISANAAVADTWVSRLRNALRGLGYEDGRNIVLDVRYSDFNRERIQRFAEEFVANRPAVIVTQGGGIVSIARITKSIPIVAAFSGDLVESGLAKSLAHPGGNVTGVQLLNFELVGKRIETLKEILPAIERLAVVASPTHPGVQREREETERAARQLRMTVSYHPVNNGSELAGGLDAVRAAGAQAIVSFPDGLTFPLRAKISEFALQHRMATVSGWDGYAHAGHLVTYGPKLSDVYAQMAHQVVRILKGADPATLPVELPATFELVLNLKTARALGIQIPPAVLARADRVIE